MSWFPGPQNNNGLCILRHKGAGDYLGAYVLGFKIFGTKKSRKIYNHEVSITHILQLDNILTRLHVGKILHRVRVSRGDGGTTVQRWKRIRGLPGVGGSERELTCLGRALVMLLSRTPGSAQVTAELRDLIALDFVLFIASRCWVQLFVEYAKPVSFKWFSKCLFGLKQLHV